MLYNSCEAIAGGGGRIEYIINYEAIEEFNCMINHLNKQRNAGEM
jgi:hypothetical protein